MKIILKKDWDVDISAPLIDKAIEGHFVGRDRETKLLSNEILRRNNGSILVSGHRGVGKTSLVYKSLRNAKEKDKNIKVVLLNASQLEAHSRHKENQEKVPIDAREIIENLIRRLYSATINLQELNKDTKEKIEDLYRKAVAQKFKLLESYQKHRYVSKEVLFDKNNLISIIFLIIAGVFQFFSIPSISSTIKNLLVLLFASLPYIYVRYKKEFIGKAEKLYAFDNSIGNLEFDLEQIHREFKTAKKKLVYVIDEMDKLETGQIKDVLKFFKNLFTLSDAIFIFIGGEDLYNLGIIAKDEADIKDETATQKEYEYRAKEYTYFTSRYFLSRPLWDELSNYYTEIINHEELSDHELEILKRAIAFDSKNDFFDLKTFIKDRIKSFNEDYTPLIEIDKLFDNDKQKARFHKAITTLFEDKYIAFNQSRWKENELLLRKLFQHAHQIYSSYSGYQITDPQGETIEDSEIRDFNGFLWRLGVLSSQSEKPQKIKGQQIDIRTYQYTGSFPSEPPEKLEELTEFEKGFVIKFENYINYILTFHNAFRIVNRESEITQDDFWRNSNQLVRDIKDAGFDTFSQFDANNLIYQNMVNKKPPHPYKREQIEHQTNQIFSHTNSMLINSLQIVSNFIIFLNKKNQNLDLQKQTLQNNGNLFSGAANQIRNALLNTNHLVVFKPDLSCQILLIHDTADRIKNISKNIEENASRHRVICFAEHHEDLQFEGLHLVNMEDPSQMKETLIAMLSEINKFFQNDNGKIG